MRAHNDVPFRVNVVYSNKIDGVKFNRLLQFDRACNVINEENKKAGPTLISAALETSRESTRTSLFPDLHMQREGAQALSP